MLKLFILNWSVSEKKMWIVTAKHTTNDETL